MNINFYKKTALAMAVLGASVAGTAFAGSPYSLIPNHRFSKPMFNSMTMPMQHKGHSFGVKDLDAQMVNQAPATRGAIVEPSNSFDKLPDYQELSTPYGTYFVTSKFTYDYIEHNEYYTEEIIKGFEFTFYDPDFNYAGTIKDDIHINADLGESTPAHVMLDNLVTKHFFNDDDNLEFIVYTGIRTGAPNYWVHFYETVYSLNGEKSENGFDKPILTLPGRNIDTIQAGSDDSSTIMCLANDQYFTADDFADPVERANNSVTHMKFYHKGADGNLEEFWARDVKLAQYPGDTTESLYIISKVVNGVPYYIFTYYELPYFVNPLGGAEDESATANNNFVIDVFKYENGQMNEASQTKIPVVIPFDIEKLHYTFYSVGNLTWKQDIDMTVNGTPESPAFIVRTDETLASDLDNVSSSYNIYDVNGNIIRPLSVGTESFFVMNSAGSLEPHIMFVKNDEVNGYSFEFMDLYSGRVVLSIPQEFGNESLTAVCQRIYDKDAGIYKYAFVGMYDSLDDDGNTLKRVIWIDQDGNLDHVDNLNVGKDIQLASVNLDSASLDPYFYDSDPQMEYAVLVKRTYGETVRNEFLIVDDKGEWYANFNNEDGRGEPLLYLAMPGADTNKLYMIYEADNFRFNIDVYNLPFETLGVGSVIDDKIDSTVIFDGETIDAANAYVEVYNTSGIRVAAAHGSVPVANLAAGMYIVRVTDQNGKAVTLKIAK